MEQERPSGICWRGARESCGVPLAANEVIDGNLSSWEGRTHNFESPYEGRRSASALIMSHSFWRRVPGHQRDLAPQSYCCCRFAVLARQGSL